MGTSGPTPSSQHSQRPTPSRGRKSRYDIYLSFCRFALGPAGAAGITSAANRAASRDGLGRPPPPFPPPIVAQCSCLTMRADYCPTEPEPAEGEERGTVTTTARPALSPTARSQSRGEDRVLEEDWVSYIPGLHSLISILQFLILFSVAIMPIISPKLYTFFHDVPPLCSYNHLYSCNNNGSTPVIFYTSPQSLCSIIAVPYQVSASASQYNEDAQKQLCEVSLTSSRMLWKEQAPHAHLFR